MKQQPPSPRFIAIYTGEGAKGVEVEAVSNIINTVIPGGQPMYRYIISAE